VTVTEQPSLTGSSEFAERVLDVLNSGMLALMISIGHRSGLFDAMAALPPATSGRIAQVAGLDERYVPGMVGGDDQPDASSTTTRRR